MPRVVVCGVPAFVEPERLLGPGAWAREEDTWAADLTREAAADLAARLRGLELAGRAVTVVAQPPLKRALIRSARTDDARRRRDTSPGFTKAGTRLDDEGRASLTPEALALELGRRARGQRVIDACCGCGGNAIGFARAGCDVVAIDTSAERLALARHNAQIYGVAERIRFVAGRAEAELGSLQGDLVFVDPPWSDLAVLPSILDAAAPFPRVWIKVPPAFDPSRIPGSVPEAWFGVAAGDRQRIKFVVLAYEGR